MNRDLDRDRLDAVAERELRAALQAGPWCWPADEESEQWRRAIALVPAGPPDLPAGVIPLVTVDRSGAAASLWALRLGVSDAGGVSFEADALQAWDDAAMALPRSLPFLWSPVKQARDAARRVDRLVTVSFDAQAIPRPRELRGRSFGLAFVLVMASEVLGVPVPGDVAASATVEPSGEVGSVEDIERKIAVIEREAPRTRKLLVATDQSDAARAAAMEIKIVPVASARQAIDLVFGDAFCSFLEKAGSDPGSRSELVDSLFRLALLGRGAAVDWTPVERGAGVALESWRELDINGRWRLEFARAVASRHEDNRGAMPLPTDDQLKALPPSVRVSVVTHVVQHCADTGTPAVGAVEEFAAPFLVAVPEAFTPQLKLLGARARLLAITGHPEEALALQRELAQAFVDRLEYGEVSYQLSEWYRLTGALGDRDEFEQARRLQERIARLGALGFTGDRYVDLARSRAMVALGVVEGGEPMETLRSLASNGRAPAHVRWSAVRWLARLLDENGRDAQRETVLQPLIDAAERETGRQRTARSRRVLTELDFALRRNQEGNAAACVKRLDEVDPGPIGHLVKAATDRQADPGEYVARFYPY
jgi:hypothetical protein